MIKDLVFVSPESEGLSSEKILKFLDIVNGEKLNLHSFALARHGKIMAEGYFKPFDKDFRHRIYSCSKSFVALAVGKLIGDGYVKLSDKIIDYFPEYKPVAIDDLVKEITIEDCLTMRVSLPTTTYYSRDDIKYLPLEKDWAKSFFCRYKSIKPNGCSFDYNTSASYILGVLVEKLTGKTFLHYLNPVFEKIGVATDLECVQSPDGFSHGGSGVLITLRDYLKVSELMMHKGEYNGEQLLPRDYMENATANLVETVIDGAYGDDCRGYGYQIWQSGFGFAMLGMGGQLSFMCPDKDFIFVCNADMQCSVGGYGDKIANIVKYLFYDNLSDTPLKENKAAYSLLNDKLSRLELVNGYGKKTSSIIEKINGATYVCDKNPADITDFTLNFNGDEGEFNFTKDGVKKTIKFGMEKFVKAPFPETKYYGMKIGFPAERELDALTSASFISDKFLLIRVYIADVCFGHLGITIEFNGKDTAIVKMVKNAEHFFYDYKGLFAAKRS